MKIELLNVIKCPFCGSNLRVGQIYSQKNDFIINGNIKCECNTYPIIEGILILKNHPLKEYILEYLDKREEKKALALLLGQHTEDFCKVVNCVKKMYLGNFWGYMLLEGFYSKEKSSVKNLSEDGNFFDKLNDSPFGVYLKHRFSSQTLWSFYPFIPLVQHKNERVLDLCCGAGHASYLTNIYINPAQLISVDNDFKNLYLASNYFSKGEFINFDANNPLPFKNHIFSLIYMIDAFHYIENRSLLASEIIRTLDNDGIFLLLHIHNLFASNIVPGKPMSPERLRSLFNDKKITVISENRILNDFLLNDCIDLSKRCSEGELQQSDALIILSGLEPCYSTDLWKALIEKRDNIILNPIYKLTRFDGKLILERKIPNESFLKEYPLTEAYLPKRVEIDDCILSKQLRAGETEMLTDLMRKFVIINAPENYLDADSL